QIRERRSFMVWDEGSVPSVIFEITSKSTWVELVTKSTLYASLGVQEYFIFDPLEEYLEQTLQGFELQDREFVPKEPVEPGIFYCEQLHLNIQREDILLRLSVPETGEKLLNTDEAIVKAYEEQERAEQEAQRAEQEALRANAAEAEIARRRAQLAVIQNNDQA
ncbi:MAG: Uma2 family endonuclease, partial [Caldilineaceae bacterium]|nr:Uma2 family endonuclease [Caldilineaceae bacterium]